MGINLRSISTTLFADDAVSTGLSQALAYIASPNAEVGDQEAPAERTTQGAPGD